MSTSARGDVITGKRSSYNKTELTLCPDFDGPDSVGVAGELRDCHLRDLETVPQNPQGRPGSSAASGIQLGSVLVGEICDGRRQDGAEGLKLVDEDKVSQRPWGEEEGVSLLEGHRRAELWLVVVVAEMGDLVQETEGKNRNYSSNK